MAESALGAPPTDRAPAKLAMRKHRRAMKGTKVTAVAGFAMRKHRRAMKGMKVTAAANPAPTLIAAGGPRRAAPVIETTRTTRRFPPAPSERVNPAAGAEALYLTVRQAIKEADAAQCLTAAPGDDEGWLKDRQDDHRSQRRGRKRKEKERDKESSSPTALPASSTRPEQPFRKASSAGSSGGRAPRDADRVPRGVLVDTLYEIASVLPRPVGEANPSKAVLDKEEPTLFMSLFGRVLKPIFETTGGSASEVKEAMTICQTLDSLPPGGPKRALMVHICGCAARLAALQEAKASSKDECVVRTQSPWHRRLRPRRGRQNRQNETLADTPAERRGSSTAAREPAAAAPERAAAGAPVKLHRRLRKLSTRSQQAPEPGAREATKDDVPDAGTSPSAGLGPLRSPRPWSPRDGLPRRPLAKESRGRQLAQAA